MQSAKPDIHRLIEFHRLLLQFQAVERRVHIPHDDSTKKRWENDTEHSYNLAMAAWFLASSFPHLDRDKIIRYALAHDIVEVHAGDTYIYGDQSELDSKADREADALKRLEEEWADFPELTQTIHSYEARADEEAKFVYALDKIMPIIVIFIGRGRTWHAEGITPEQLHEAKRRKVTVSPEIAKYYDELYQLLTENRHYFPSGGGKS